MPRATLVSTGSMELFRSWGLEAELTEAAIDVRFTGFLGETLAAQQAEFPVGVPSTEQAAVVSPNVPLAVTQDVLEPILLRHFAGAGRGPRGAGDGAGLVRAARRRGARARARPAWRADRRGEPSDRRRRGAQPCARGAGDRAVGPRSGPRRGHRSDPRAAQRRRRRRRAPRHLRDHPSRGARRRVRDREQRRPLGVRVHGRARNDRAGGRDARGDGAPHPPVGRAGRCATCASSGSAASPTRRCWPTASARAEPSWPATPPTRSRLAEAPG